MCTTTWVAIPKMPQVFSVNGRVSSSLERRSGLQPASLSITTTTTPHHHQRIVSFSKQASTTPPHSPCRFKHNYREQVYKESGVPGSLAT